MLRNFHNTFLSIILYFQGFSDIRKLPVFKNNIYNRSHNLSDLTFIHPSHFLFWAFAPLITSVIVNPLTTFF